MNKNYTLFSLTNAYQDRSAKPGVASTDRFWEEGMFFNEEMIDCSPSDYVIKKIIDFAKSYDVVNTVPVGYIELNLN